MAPPRCCVLEITGLRAGYGAIEILRGVDLAVGAGEIVALLGSNGAGKSTLNNNVCGLFKPFGGTVRFDGKDIAGAASTRIVEEGLIQVPEGRRVFPNLSVRDNLIVAASRNVKARRWTLDTVFDTFPTLKDRHAQSAGLLSGGEQQMLTIGRALMGNPSVLLMDEPSEGLAPQIVAEVGRIIARLKQEGQSIVLVEQNVQLALALADDVVILNTGRVVFAGGVEGVRGNHELISQQLGVV
jgi:branched-chain amino acid transport system ATP-binding protein